MAFALTSALSALGLPGELLGGLIGSHAQEKSLRSPSLLQASRFGSILNGQIDALGAGDPLAQLTALLQNGTPISTIVDRLASQIADAVQKRLPTAQLGSGASRAQLIDSIKVALSPPSNAPPGTPAAQQVAALERRLEQWLGGVAREVDRKAGQQSDISGQVLDANTARELPAQQDPNPTPNSRGASALAQSLLASVAASLSAGSPPSPVASFRAAPPPTASTSTLPTTASTLPTTAPALPTTASTLPTTAPADLLARMLIRAAGVDTQLNQKLVTVGAIASAPLPTARIASAAPAVGAAPVPTPAITAARLTVLLTEAIAAAASSGRGDAPAGGDTSPQNPNPNADLAAESGSAPAVAAKLPARSDALAFAVLAGTSNPATQTSAPPLAAPPGAADPNAVIEQLVKGMSMRTGLDGTSEMQLHLSPASLGTVTMKLTVDGSSVSANVVAANADVRNALMANQGQLARSLAESGLKLTSFTVDLSGGNAGNHRNQDPTTGFGRRYAVHEAAGIALGNLSEGSFGPSLLHGSMLGLFNYLA